MFSLVMFIYSLLSAKGGIFGDVIWSVDEVQSDDCIVGSAT